MSGRRSLLLDAVHARRRGVDEAAHALVLRDLHEGQERVVVDRLAQLRVQLEARVVGDAGQVDDRVDTGQSPSLQQPAVPDVSPDLAEARMATDSLEHLVTENVQVQDGDPVTPGEQLGDQDGPDMSAPPVTNMLAHRLLRVDLSVSEVPTFRLLPDSRRACPGMPRKSP